MKELIIGLVIAALAIWLLFALPRISEKLLTASIFNVPSLPAPTSTSPVVQVPVNDEPLVPREESSIAVLPGRLVGRVIFIDTCGGCTSRTSERVIQIYREGGILAATTPLDPYGNFSIALAPGTYAVNITHLSSRETSNTPFAAVIRSGETTRSEFAVQLWSGL